MLCPTYQDKNQSNFGAINDDSYGTFATVDSAFEQPGSLNKMVEQNPNNSDSVHKINNNIKNFISDKKYYKRNEEYQKLNNPQLTNREFLYPNIPVIQDGIAFPLNRYQYYPARRLGTTLLENFDLQQQANNAWYNANATSREFTGMNFYKFILLVILIVLVIYGGCLLYKNGQSNI
jgi:hypothetical protein